MCNACGNLCCGSDEFGGCGCFHCGHPDCADEACTQCGEPADTCGCDDFADDFEGAWEE